MHTIRHFHDVRPNDVADDLGSPRMGISVPISTWSGITGHVEEDDPSFQIFNETRTVSFAETYDEEPCPLARRLASIARAEGIPPIRQSRSLTSPMSTLEDFCAMAQCPPDRPSPSPLPRTTADIVGYMWLDGDLLPVYDGRPLADLDDRHPSVSLSWEDFCTMSS